MSAERPQTDTTDPNPAAPKPITELNDPRLLSILHTEHWSLLSARSLAYNEAFTRGGMFLSFLSMSFVALALLAQAMTFDKQFLVVAAILLAFDLVIGLTTYGRISGANVDDLRALHGMARIRHAYTQVAPMVTPYFTTATHDDVDTVTEAYGAPSGGVGQFLYGLSTSGGMIGLIVAMVGGVLVGVLALLVGVTGGLVVWIGVIGAVLVFVALVAVTFGTVPRVQAGMEARFPAPGPEAEAEAKE